MALVATPMMGNRNSARVECTDCPAVLVVSGIGPSLIRALVESADAQHDCAA